MNSQLEDNGAVIGYKPVLEYIKEMNQESTVNTNSGETGVDGNTQYSSTLTGLINNTPSQTISDVDYVAENIKTLIDELSNSFNLEKWNEYNSISSLLNAVAIDDKTYINDFIASHKNNINGSIVPEIIGHLYNTEKRMEVLNETLKEMYYGNANISQEEMEAIDNENIAKMKSYEESNESYKVNYVSISYDSVLNRIISTESFNINKSVIKLSDIVNNAETFTDDSSNMLLITQLYSEVNDDIQYREEAFGIQQTVEIMQKTLYNYYNKRNNYVALYNIYNGQEGFNMTHRLYDYKYKLDRSVENVVRTLQGNQYYLSQLTALEQEKYSLMSNYSKLNYNY